MHSVDTLWKHGGHPNTAPSTALWLSEAKLRTSGRHLSVTFASASVASGGTEMLSIDLMLRERHALLISGQRSTDVREEA